MQKLKMGIFKVTKVKERELLSKMEELQIKEEDLIEKFIRSSGPGGQKTNKSSSAVYLKHIPSGIEVKCSKDRSRSLNRYYARKILCEKIEEALKQEKSARRKKAEKIRRQKRRRSRRAKAKILEDKRKTSAKKEMRRPVTLDAEEEV